MGSWLRSGSFLCTGSTEPFWRCAPLVLGVSSALTLTLGLTFALRLALRLALALVLAPALGLAYAAFPPSSAGRPENACPFFTFGAPFRIF